MPISHMPDWWVLGGDILKDMISEEDCPLWTYNDEGSAFVPNLGDIKMNFADFAKWCSHTFQTCLWLGTSTPSHKSQENCQLIKASSNTPLARGAGKLLIN